MFVYQKKRKNPIKAHVEFALLNVGTFKITDSDKHADQTSVVKNKVSTVENCRIVD